MVRLISDIFVCEMILRDDESHQQRGNLRFFNIKVYSTTWHRNESFNVITFSSTLLLDVVKVFLSFSNNRKKLIKRNLMTLDRAS